MIENDWILFRILTKPCSWFWKKKCAHDSKETLFRSLTKYFSEFWLVLLRIAADPEDSDGVMVMILKKSCSRIWRNYVRDSLYFNSEIWQNTPKQSPSQDSDEILLWYLMESCSGFWRNPVYDSDKILTKSVQKLDGILFRILTRSRLHSQLHENKIEKLLDKKLFDFIFAHCENRREWFRHQPLVQLPRTGIRKKTHPPQL